MNEVLRQKAENLDWNEKRKFLQFSRFRPMYDRAFHALLNKIPMESYFRDPPVLRETYLKEFDQWLHGSTLNQIKGLEQFPDRDFTLGVTHSLDDLHIVFGDRLVVYEKEYAYHTRIRPETVRRNLQTLQKGDVLVFGAPFAWHGGLHPDTQEILDRCLQLEIPVHIDAAWYGCLKGFEFDYSHPAIQTVSFSLSKGLGLGSHRTGVRYARKRHAGPVTVINDFNMCIVSVMWYGLHFIREFGSDYLQNRYGEAYDIVCEKLGLEKTNAIHVAFGPNAEGEIIPVGIRPFLRYLVDDLDEFQ